MEAGDYFIDVPEGIEQTEFPAYVTVSCMANSVNFTVNVLVENLNTFYIQYQNILLAICGMKSFKLSPVKTEYSYHDILVMISAMENVKIKNTPTEDVLSLRGLLYEEIETRLKEKRA